MRRRRLLSILISIRLNEDDLRELASLFDKLDSEACRLGGADKQDNI